MSVQMLKTWENGIELTVEQGGRTQAAGRCQACATTPISTRPMYRGVGDVREAGAASARHGEGSPWGACDRSEPLDAAQTRCGLLHAVMRGMLVI